MIPSIRKSGRIVASPHGALNPVSEFLRCEGKNVQDDREGKAYHIQRGLHRETTHARRYSGRSVSPAIPHSDHRRGGNRQKNYFAGRIICETRKKNRFFHQLWRYTRCCLKASFSIVRGAFTAPFQARWQIRFCLKAIFLAEIGDLRGILSQALPCDPKPQDRPRRRITPSI